MNIFHGFETAHGCGPLVLGIGTFDGVHRGHRALIQEVVDIATQQNVAPAVFTFHPHPMGLLGEEAIPPLVCGLDCRIRQFKKYGIQITIVQDLHGTFSTYTPQEYIHTVLKSFPASVVVVGSDFTFGKDRSGDINTLRTLGNDVGITVSEIETVNDSHQPVSSSRIRKSIAVADFQETQKMLGRYYSLTGNIERGQQRGRGLGFPTANIQAGECVQPPAGVYAAWAVLNDNQYFKSAVHVGPVVTFGMNQPTIEAHFINFQSRDLYGEHLELYFVEKMRDVVRFSSAETLVMQIKADVINTKLLLEKYPYEMVVTE